MTENTKPATRAQAKKKISKTRAATIERHGKALDLRRAGLSLDVIAKQLGYGSRASVSRALSSELKRVVTEPAEDLLKMEIERMDRLRAGHWTKAVGGDVASANIVLKVSERVAKLRGLDDYERRMAEVAERKQALDEQQAALMAAAMAALIGRLNLTPEQMTIARIAAPEEMRRISA